MPASSASPVADQRGSNRRWTEPAHHVDPETEQAARLQPADAEQPVPPSRRMRWLPAIIGGVVVSVILVAAAVGYRDLDDSVKIQTVERFGIGTCVAETDDVDEGTEVIGPRGAQRITTVDCALPHLGEVVDRVTFPRPCPYGRPYVWSEERFSICLA